MSDAEGMGNRPKRPPRTGCAWRRADLRHGYTTSACAAAAAVGATRVLLGGISEARITVDLPAEAGAAFEIVRCESDGPEPTRATCATIKDAGDDPDVTDGAEIVATVSWRQQPGIELAAGRGVGVVTRPGLPVPVGQPAINPGAQRIIRRAVEVEAGTSLAGRGLHVEISVPRGEELALETLNPKLGIVGGISILGTDGIVRPYSQPAYRAAILAELKVAAAAGVRTIVFATGKRSAEYALRRHSELPELACVQVGDHMGYALKQARRLGFGRAVVSGMVGKISKLAQGRMQTHVSQGSVDMGFLSEVVRRFGAREETTAAVAAANTARHAQNILARAGLDGLEQRLAELAAEEAAAFVAQGLEVEVLLWSLSGDLLAAATARAPEGQA